MAVVRVFVSFEFERDSGLKDSFIEQAGQYDSLFTIKDTSLKGPYHEAVWVGAAQEAIDRSDAVIVLVGPDTHNAPGVLQEVKMAKRLNKPIFQIRPQGKAYGGVRGAGEIHSWRWKPIRSFLGNLTN